MKRRNIEEHDIGKQTKTDNENNENNEDDIERENKNEEGFTSESSLSGVDTFKPKSTAGSSFITLNTRTTDDDHYKKQAALQNKKDYFYSDSLTPSLKTEFEEYVNWYKNLGAKNQIACIKTVVQGQSDIYTISHNCMEINNSIKIDFLKELPPKVRKHVLSYLNAKSLCVAREVSKHWNEAASEECLWKRLCYQHINKKCTKCGWGLPMDTNTQDDCQSQDPKFWKTIFSTKMAIEQNWRKGNFKNFEFLGHEGPVLCLEFAKDVIVSGSADKTVRVWSIKEGKCTKVFRGHNASVVSLQFDFVKVISGSTDGVVRICSLESGQCVRTIESHKGSCQSLQFDNTQLVTGGADSVIKVWNFTDGKCHVLYGHTDQVNCVRIHNNDLLSASDDGTLRIWDLTQKTCKKILQGHNNEVLCGQLSHTRVVSGGADNTIRIWDLLSGTCTKTLFGHTDAVRFVQFDNLRIVSASDDGTIKIWDLETGNLTNTLSADHSNGINSLQFNESKILGGCNDNKLLVWDFS